MDRFGGAYCTKCLVIVNKKTRDLKRKYKSEGRCVDCGEKNDTKFIRCELCNKAHNHQNREYRDGFDYEYLELDLIKLNEELENENTKCKIASKV